MNKKNKTVSYDELHRLFNYNSETGLLIWKNGNRKTPAGATVGSLNKEINGTLILL